MNRLRPLMLVGALAAAACSSGGGDGTLAGGDGNGGTTTMVPGPTETATPGPTETTGPTGTTVPGTQPTTPPATQPSAGADPAGVSARLVLVARVTKPTAMAVRPGDGTLYVAEQTGRVRAVPSGQSGRSVDPLAVPALDLSGEVSGGSEQGLLGLVFSPSGDRLYVDYTDRQGRTQVVEYAFADGRADPGTRRTLLTVDQPFPNHNGGDLAFGPDGLLYVSLGDGGSANDPDNNGQNLSTLLGTILRIDPAPAGGAPYGLPGANPFVGREGARPEIWAYGLRNPWRFSFDRQTGAVWIGDVGQNAVEEIDFLPPGHPGGANFGWPLLEGSRRVKGQNPPGGVLPIFEYGHDAGCSVTGGYVYRGAAIPSLRGIYVFSDVCSGTLWGLVEEGGANRAQAEMNIAREAGEGGRLAVSSFGEDNAGELYVLDLGGAVYRFEP